jgi:hypothetical protein
MSIAQQDAGKDRESGQHGSVQAVLMDGNFDFKPSFVWGQPYFLPVFSTAETICNLFAFIPLRWPARFERLRRGDRAEAPVGKMMASSQPSAGPNQPA